MKFNPWFAVAFFIIAYVGAALAFLGVWGLALIPVVVGISAAIGMKVAAWKKGVLALLCLFTAPWIISSFDVPRSHPRYFENHTKLQTIGTYLITYHLVRGSFPPSTVTSTEGKPLYSWRVAICAGSFDLGQKFDLAEPWDSPANLDYVGDASHVYASHVFSSSATSRDPSQTPFRMIESHDENTLGEHERIIVMEAGAVPWIQPDHFTREDAFQLLTSADPSTLPHPGRGYRDMLLWERRPFFYALTTRKRVIECHGDLPEDLARQLLSADHPWDEDLVAQYADDRWRFKQTRLSGMICFLLLSVVQLIWWIRWR